MRYIQRQKLYSEKDLKWRDLKIKKTSCIYRWTVTEGVVRGVAEMTCMSHWWEERLMNADGELGPSFGVGAAITLMAPVWNHTFPRIKETGNIWQHTILCDGFIRSFGLSIYTTLRKTIKACNTILIALVLLEQKYKDANQGRSPLGKVLFYSPDWHLWLFLCLGPQMPAAWSSL